MTGVGHAALAAAVLISGSVSLRYFARLERLWDAVHLQRPWISMFGEDEGASGEEVRVASA